MSEYETILVGEHEGVVTITMNRPDRLNAWTYQMGAEMSDAVEAANADDDVLAIVVTGAGRGFCAGADMQDVFEADADSVDRPQRRRGRGRSKYLGDVARCGLGSGLGHGRT